MHIFYEDLRKTERERKREREREREREIISEKKSVI